jgi:rhodanese-related sulfurtransferase
VISPVAIDVEECDRHNRQFGYAGDISAEDAWALLGHNAAAMLVDVRTSQEWEQIGLPDLSSLKKEPLRLSWMFLPSGEANSEFVSQFSRMQVAGDTPVLLLCRSGGRSQAAAMALTRNGYRCCFNVAGGFEGPNGWKAKQLPSA